jgi:hypothetical protein
MFKVVTVAGTLGTYTTEQGAYRAILRARRSHKYPGVATWWIIPEEGNATRIQEAPWEKPGLEASELISLLGV